MSGCPVAICFDAYDTLVTLRDPSGRLAEELARAGAPVPLAVADEAFRAEADYYRAHTLEAPDEPRLRELQFRCAERLLAVVGRHTRHSLTPAAAREALLAALDFQPTDGAVECLRTLAAAGVRMAVVSNWDCSLPAVLERVGVARWFLHVTASAVIGCEKPAPGTWSAALDALAGAQEVWHVGDEPLADGQGAMAAGLRPILLSAAPVSGCTTIADLRELPGLLPLEVKR